LIMEPEEYKEFDHSVRAYQEQSKVTLTPDVMLELFRIATLDYALNPHHHVEEAMETADKRVWGEIDVRVKGTSDE